jgi:RNA polymerase sigma factor (sigma-70 family)
MNDQTDAQLLMAYAEGRSEAAFAELVRRHVDFVYSAAIRLVRDPHWAEDVTQKVFVALSGNARALADRTVLSGWLHRTARNIAIETVRSIERRRAREQEAAIMNESLAAPDEPSWAQIAPHLDAALQDLDESDRDALLLRYFERKSAREMAQILGVTDEAAQKRVHRAVDRLRALFHRRGIAVGVSGLIAVLTTQAVQAAPSALVSALAGHAGALLAASATTPAVAKGILTMSLKQKIAVALVALILFGWGLSTFLHYHVLPWMQQDGARAQAPRLSNGLEFRWVIGQAETNTPGEWLPTGAEPTQEGMVRVSTETLLDGRHIESATLRADDGVRKEIQVWLTETARQTLAQATAARLGHQLAIVWNGRVVSAPQVKSPLRDRSLNITGLFGDTETQVLMDALNHR